MKWVDCYTIPKQLLLVNLTILPTCDFVSYATSMQFCNVLSFNLLSNLEFSWGSAVGFKLADSLSLSNHVEEGAHFLGYGFPIYSKECED